MAKKKARKKIAKHSIFHILPLGFLFFVYPFWVQYNVVNNPIPEVTWFSTSPTLADIFLYGKMHLLLVISVVMLAFLIWMLFQNRTHLSDTIPHIKKFIPLGIYALFIVLSTIFAGNSSLSFTGMYGIYENIWVLLSYFIVCIFGYWFIATTDNHSSLIRILSISVILIGCLCFLQMLGIDPYLSLFADHNATTMVEGVYGTFANPNYLGSFIALVLPILLVVLITTYKDIKVSVPLAIAVLLMLLALWSSGSAGAFIGLMAAIILAGLIFLFRKMHLSARKFAGTLIGLIALAIIAVTVLLNYAKDSKIFDTKPLTTIYTNDDNVEFHYNGDIFYFTSKNTETEFVLSCYDGKTNQKIDTRITNGAYTFADSRLEGFTAKPIIFGELDNLVGFEISHPYYYQWSLSGGQKLGACTWYFTNNYETGTYHYISSLGVFQKLTAENESDGILFNELPEFLSGRGYIWSRSLLLLKDSLLIGSGPDSFATQFPNEDIIGAQRAGLLNTFISKPHNMYLQIGIQTGHPSLIAFFVFFILYFYDSIKLYLSHSLKDAKTVLGFGIFLGTSGYKSEAKRS